MANCYLGIRLSQVVYRFRTERPLIFAQILYRILYPNVLEST
jgi:hypothetical protein